MGTGPGFDLKTSLAQELKLPEINGAACVHAWLDGARCRACVDACPRKAWVLNDDALGLDVEACDGCGLCLPACPPGALSFTLPWVIRPFGGNMIALFACERSDVEAEEARLPCIHALGERQLLLFYAAGVHYLMLASARCSDCSRNQEMGIGERLAQLNHLLAERHHPPMKLLERPAAVWRKLYQTDVIIPRGTRLGRRRFLGGSGKQIREQLAVVDPLNLPESRTLPPGELLPDAAGKGLHWPWSVILDDNRCNGCDACTRLCPTGAIELSVTEGNAVYRISSSRCTGCGACETVCDAGAVSIERWGAEEETEIPLVRNRCRACGNSYHEPEPGDGDDLCRICRKQNHAALLFQIIE